jgi:hypothetical protein
VYQQIGDVSKVKGGLQGVTVDVEALAQTFDQDLGGTTAAVGQMIKTGLVKDAKEGLDVLTKGFQAGNDKAGRPARHDERVRRAVPQLGHPRPAWPWA